MIVAPAIDLKEGRYVQLVGGRPEDERISLPDAVVVAERWWRVGFRTLHLVDLDAALGTGDNLALTRQVLQATPAVTQVGGGIRDDARADALLEAGADRVVVGTRALDDPVWLASLAERRPGRVLVAADTRDGRVLRKGWTERSELSLADLLQRLEGLPLAGVLATDVGREGRMEGIDRDAVAHTLRSSPHPMWVSGGVTTEDDLAWLDGEGAAGAVLGMAIYTGALHPERLAERWGAGGERSVDDDEQVGDDT